MQSKLPIAAFVLTLMAVAHTAAAVSPITDVFELFPVEPGVNTERGFAVALDDGRLAVGAPLDDGAGLENAGAVYIFRWEESFWAREAKLFADPSQSEGARFGSAVALRGGVLAVGAIGEGAVYLFDHNSDGVWTQRRRLAVAEQEQEQGVFGRAVALDDDGDLLAVGAVGPHGRGPGAVYLYSLLDANPWTEAPLRIAPALPQPQERFGQAVALATGLLVVGAPGHSPRAEEAYAGAAYVFRQSGASWTEVTTLVAVDPEPEEQLGAAVATDGTTIALGAPAAHRPEVNSGAVYVATCSEGGCGPPERLANPDAEGPSPGLLGFSLAVQGNLLAVGAPGPGSGDNPGGLQLYRRILGSWLPRRAVSLPRNMEALDFLGFAVALDDRRVVAGGMLGDQGGAAAGAVWSFTFRFGRWREEAEVVARDPLLEKAVEPVIRFGVSVAATEQYLVIGALRKGGQQSPGAVYVYRRAVYRRVGSGWRQEARLTSPAGEDARDAFGTAVAVDGESLLVGAPAGGAAYLFVRRDGIWSLERPFFSGSVRGDPLASDGFGVAVAIAGNTLAIGAPLAGPGVVHVHERESRGWSLAVSLAAKNASPGDGFGAALSLRHGTLAIGAPGRMSGSGAIYVARRLEQGKWTAPLRLATAPLLLSSKDRLGAAVTVGDGFLAAGAPGRRNGDGAVLLYEAGSSWTFAKQIDGEDKREFGSAVALHGDSLLVGAPGRGDLPPSDIDNFYLYEREEEDWKRVAPVAAINALRADRFGSAVALTEFFFVVTHPGPAGGDPETAFKLRRNAEATK